MLAPFYDPVMGDRAQHARYLRSLIQKHAPRARTLLELACGTGSILEQLWTHYDVTGLDLSEEMLEVAAEKLPGVPLFRADMRTFDLGERFDVVLCVYDSINHLLRFDEWRAVFSRAQNHLNESGLFLFDMNTKWQLAALVEEPPVTRWFGERNVLIMDVAASGRGVVTWQLRVFECLAGSRYVLHEEDIPEISFPADRVRAASEKLFARVWVYDARRSRPSPRSERLHFVCRA